MLNLNLPIELYFKAWDKENKVILKTLSMRDLCITAGFLEPSEYDRLEVLPYTGKNDKFGNKIFLKDMVTDGVSVYIVAYMQEKYILVDDSGKWIFDLGDFLEEELELVGNYFENIKEAKD